MGHVSSRAFERRPASTKAPSDVWPGRSYPLGAHYDGEGTNFSLFSEVAEGVEGRVVDDGAPSGVRERRDAHAVVGMRPLDRGDRGIQAIVDAEDALSDEVLEHADSVSNEHELPRLDAPQQRECSQQEQIGCRDGSEQRREEALRDEQDQVEEHQAHRASVTRGRT